MVVTQPISGTANWDGSVGVGGPNIAAPLINRTDNWSWGDARTTSGGTKYHDGQTTLVPASSLTDGSVVMMAVDMDNSKIWWGVDGSWMGTDTGDNDGNPATGANPAFANLSGDLFPGGACQVDPQYWNFGQLGFAHTPPTGFVGLYWSQLDDPTIADPSAYFQPTIYTGDGAASLAVNQDGNSTFSPDFVWTKNRDAADNNMIFDTARGATKFIVTNDTDAEETDATTLLSFDSDGFSVGASVRVNTSGEKYVGWQWLESATPGFDIVTYSGTAANRTISHSLGAVPELMIVRRYNAVENWGVYHGSNTSDPASEAMILDLPNATNPDVVTVWNDTAPTSSVFTVGTGGMTNSDGGGYIAYLWAGVEGFSKFGNWTGNGNADGPFVWCGFRPSYVMLKKTTGVESWWIEDDRRAPYNDGNPPLLAADSTADEDASWSGNSPCQFLSNGFKILRTGDAFNTDGGNYVFAAFASTPFKTANAR